MCSDAVYDHILAIACTELAPLVWSRVKRQSHRIDKFVSDATRIFLRAQQELEGLVPGVAGMAFAFWMRFYHQITDERSECAYACFRCGAESANDAEPLNKCGRCKVATYCSLSCQKMCVGYTFLICDLVSYLSVQRVSRDWKRHKPNCIQAPSL